MSHITLPDCKTLRNETVRYLCERVKYLEEKEHFTIFCVGMASIVVLFIAFYLSYKAKVKGAPPYKYLSIPLIGLLPVLLFFPDRAWSLVLVVVFSLLGSYAWAVEFVDKVVKANVDCLFYNNLSPGAGQKLRFLAISHFLDVFTHFVNIILSCKVFLNIWAKDRKGFCWTVVFKTLVLVFGCFKGMVAVVDEDITFGLLTDGDKKVLKLDKAEDVPSTEFDALFRYGVPDEGRPEPEISKNGSVVDGSPNTNTNTNREWKIDLGEDKVLGAEGAPKFLDIEAKPPGLVTPLGLVNLGNTCYMNSAIQCIAHTSEFASFFIGDPPYDCHLGELGAAFRDLIRDLWAPQVRGGELPPVAPRAFRDKFLRVEPRFQGYEQHDSQEFLGFLLSQLHEDLQRIDKEYCLNYIAEENYNVVDLCQGKFRSTVRCLICNQSSQTVDTFMFFSLPIHFPSSAPASASACDGAQVETLSLYSCLEAFQSEEPLVREEWWDCPRCKGKRKSSKKLEIWTPPEIFVIHLKRFSSRNEKLETFVNFPIHDLDLSNHVGNKKDPGKHLYELYAVINHRGTQKHGHYTSFIKLRDVNRWFEFDDSVVSPIEEGEVQSKIQSKDAYVLFYKKVKTDVGKGAQPCPEAVRSEDEQLATQGMHIHGDLVLDVSRLAADLIFLCQVQAETLRMGSVDVEDERRVAAELLLLSQMLAETLRMGG